MKIEIKLMPYHDPNNLEFYLLANIPEDDIQIIKEYSAVTSFGDIRIAVIGSSHFFSLYKEFCELLTCRSLKRTIPCFCNKEIIEQSLQYIQLFNNFSYRFSLEMKILSEKNFNSLEQKLNYEKHTLIHAFKINSALTVLDFQNISDKSLTLETWHTYPESLISVQTKTLIQRI